TPVTTQYAGQGITGSTGLFSDYFYTIFTGVTAPTLSNFTTNPFSACTLASVSFAPTTFVAFGAITNPGDDLVVRAYDGATLIATEQFATDLDGQLVGFTA